jgi:hypothetical protein
MNEARQFQLPVGGREIAVPRPTGIEDLSLVEATQGDTALALDLAGRLAVAEDGEALDWAQLSATDLDAFILTLRRTLIGDRIIAETACRAADCGSRIDMSFTIGAYLARYRPRRAPLHLRGWQIAPRDDRPGWYEIVAEGSAAALSFRLPSGADQLAVEGRRDAAMELARRCLEPDDAPAPLRRIAEAAMARLAPSLANDVAGACPECGATVEVHFDPRYFCLRELRERARFVYGDIDLLAQRYHWSERDILALPAARRASYAETARRAAVA